MRRFALTASVLAAALAGNALAADAPNTQNDQSVTLATVALPLVFDGQIENYVFVSVKLLLSPHADTQALRDKEPFFRDALVRAAHRTPFVRADDYNHLDDNRLKASLMREAAAIAGPGQVQSIAILSETPQHRRPSPAPQGATIVP